MEIRHKKIYPSRPGFQGNSRSLELTQIDRQPSNHGPILYRFRDKRRFRSKIAIFHPRVFNATAERVPFGII